MRVQTMWAALSGVFKWPGAPSRRWWIAVLWLAGLCQQAQAQVFTCDATMYLTQANATNTATQLFRVNRATNPFTYVPIGAEELGINALGYNPADNYLYALRTQSGAEGRRLYRISATGARTDLGLVTGLPEPTGSAYFAGAFTTANDNILYVMTATGGNTMYRINVVTRVATPLTLSRNIYFADLDFANGLFHAYETAGQLVSINPATGVVTNLGPGGPSRIFGAFYTDTSGLYGALNSGGFYRFNPNTGLQTLISGLSPSAGNDGARCPLAAPLPFDADLAITKTDGSATYVPGSTVVYTIVASNNGLFGAQNVRVQDPLPAGITTASWTCAAANGAVCTAASGTGALDARVDLPYNPAGATATFTLSMTVPASFTGDLVNTATLTPDPGNTDPTPGNNTATDTNPMGARLTLRKISLGGTGAFGFSGSNGVATQTLTTSAVGVAVSGTAQLLATPGASTTVTESGPPAGYVLSDISCSDLAAGGTATPNLATRSVTLDAAATAAGANITCTFTNSRIPQLRLRKALPSGRAVAADQFTLNMSGMAGLTTTGTGSTATGVLTHGGAVAGTAYTLSETGAGATVMAGYTTTYSCTNALPGGQAPSGAGPSFDLTPVTGDDLTCTFSNAAVPGADLRMVKTGSAASVRTGDVVSFTLTASNNGPGPAHGAVVRDVPGTGLDCSTPSPTASCSASGGAACPAATVPVASLLGAAGVTLPLLPAGGGVVITLQCRVTATGLP